MKQCDLLLHRVSFQPRSYSAHRGADSVSSSCVADEYQPVLRCIYLSIQSHLVMDIELKLVITLSQGFYENDNTNLSQDR